MLMLLPSNREPSFLLLFLSCLLNISTHGSTDIFKLFTLLCGCSTVVTVVCDESQKISLKKQIAISLVIFGLLFDVVSSAFAQLEWFSFIVVRLIIGLGVVIAYRDVRCRFAASFTSGELSIVIQGLFSFLGVSLVAVASQFSGSLLYKTSVASLVIQILCIALFIFTIILKLASTATSLSVLMPTALLITICLSYGLMFNLMPVEPISWLINEALLTDTRVQLLSQWSVYLALTVLFTVLWTKFSQTKASSPQRKLFHVPIFLVFLTGIKEDIQFLSFASACVLIIFFIVECIRLTKTNAIALLIESAFDGFRDEKDSGPLTLTHVYLLIGCALPVWLSLGTQSHSLFAASSGVISIGLGDSAASIFGSFWGKRKWPRSNKSHQGTAAAVIAQVIGSYFILTYLKPDKIINIHEVLVIVTTCSIVSLVEAFTSEIDNLVLPLYFNIFLRGLSMLLSVTL